MFYIPKKSKEIYNEIIAHRGLHLHFPENSISAYKEAIKLNMTIEIDIRLTKDYEIICIHDRYAKRLLRKKGKVFDYNYKELKDLNILNSNEKIPKLEEVLKIVNGKVPILIEVKGLYTKKYDEKLTEILSGYEGKVYFHAKNILTYIKLRKDFNELVFWILNPLRKRFNFIKV